MPIDEYKAALVDARLPPEVIELLVYLFSTVLDGRNTPFAGGVESALGKKPARFSEYVVRTSATGGWPSGRADELAVASRESVA